nr:MAG TPA: hypothetical protein [Bacteriophage sp.]
MFYSFPLKIKNTFQDFKRCLFSICNVFSFCFIWSNHNLFF